MLLFEEKIQVQWAPQQQIGAAIKVFGYYILKGLQASDVTLQEVTDDLVNNTCKMGLAYIEDPFKPMGCWLTDLRMLDDGLKYATVYALSGQKLPRWIKAQEELMIPWARAEGCHSIRFFGKAAYRTLLEDLRVIGQTDDGRALLFEKRLAA